MQSVPSIIHTKGEKAMIETYIIEEHHEAFLVWQLAKENGIVPPKENVLLHVDEHSDLSAPRCKRSILNLRTLEDAEFFTYNDLKIGNFILPAIYQGLFGSVYWIKQNHQECKSYQRYVRSINTQGKRFTILKTIPEGIDLTNDDVQVFGLHKQEIEDLDCPEKVMLDIDLDYFSTNEDPREMVDTFIEITENEYESFVNNKYHLINFLGANVEAVKHNNQYFYAFHNYDEVYASRLKRSEDNIVKQMDKFMEKLDKMNIQPSLITICRSAYSGFTPSDQCEFIQNILLDGLNNLYDLQIHDGIELSKEELVTST